MRAGRDAGFFGRWGLAVAAPRRALAIADDPAWSGRASGDLLRAIGVLLVVAQTRALVAAGWVAIEVGPGMAVPRLLRALSGAAMVALVFVVIAALVVTVAAGRKRSMSADFELACVAALAPVTVALVATVVAAVSGGAGPVGRGVALAAAMGWGGAVTALAVRAARQRRPRTESEMVAETGTETERETGTGTELEREIGTGTGTGTGTELERRRGRAAAWGVVAVAGAALAINGAWIARHVDWLRPLEAGAKAPSFDLPVVANGEGRVTDAALRGQVVVLDFWATWCKPCLLALPHLDAAARRWGDQVRVIAVNVDDGDKAVALFARTGYRVMLAADDGEASTRYQVDLLPHVVVIDRDGVVRVVGEGVGGERDAEEAVERLLTDR